MYRDRGNPLEVYDEIDIKNLFCFQSPHIIQITEDVQEHLQRNTGRSRALAPLQQVCVALRFYATDYMQLSLGAWINIHQSTVSRTVGHVTAVLLQIYPDSFNVVGSSKAGFYEQFGMPNILGCVDVAPIKIKAPHICRHPDEYINRKNIRTINVQGICDSDCVFTDVDVSWPGNVHDSRILKNSDVYMKLLSENCRVYF